jgi:hypothetical protein
MHGEANWLVVICAVGDITEAIVRVTVTDPLTVSVSESVQLEGTKLLVNVYEIGPPTAPEVSDAEAMIVVVADCGNVPMQIRMSEEHVTVCKAGVLRTGKL